MNNRFACLKIVLAAAMLCGVLSYSDAANGKPVELAADSIEYDASQGVMVAEGTVVLTQDNAVLTGARAEYNTKTQEAYITGSVKVEKEGAVLTALEVRTYNNNHIAAKGDVVLLKGDNRLTGETVDYYTDKQYAVVPNGARMTMKDGMMTAHQLEAFLNEDKVAGSGSVHITSETQKLDTVSDHAVYYGDKSGGGQSKVILTGNARAVQDGNVLTGNELTIYPDTKAMTAEGRTKLIIIPKE